MLVCSGQQKLATTLEFLLTTTYQHMQPPSMLMSL